jgi:hypothetical protein
MTRQFLLSLPEAFASAPGETLRNRCKNGVAHSMLNRSTYGRQPFSIRRRDERH